MENNLPIFYLGLLLILLAAATWFVLRQIFRTRRVESTLSRLQAKLSKQKGTAQEYFELGGIYLSKNLTVQAIAQFQNALKAAEAEAETSTAPIYNGLGYAYFCQEQYDLAIRQYKEALKQNPDYITASNNLGHAYERKNLTAQALEAYEQTLSKEPKNPIALRRAESLRKRLIPSQ